MKAPYICSMIAVLLWSVSIPVRLDAGFVMDHTHLPEFDSLTQEQTDRVRALNILFSHASVGRIIMYGIQDLGDEDSSFSLSFVPDPSDWQHSVTRDDYLQSGPIFGHHNDGNNPSFFSFLAANSDIIDIAFKKYCYEYINYPGPTAQSRFNDYKSAVDSFRASNPHTVLIHCTMALRTDENSYSVERSKYRDMILAEYGNDYVFDVADLESWHDGAYTTFESDGSDYLVMHPSYTNDGGHPNESFRPVLAKALWVLLAKVAEDLSDDPPVNRPPYVSAGPDLSVTLPAAVSIDASVSDDGLPDPPAAVTVSWSKVSGPGSVTFGSPASADTMITFSAAGVYVLRLTASDSILSASDDVTVTVADPPVEHAPSIDQQPASQSVIEGETATFSVIATGTGTLTYQWQRKAGSDFTDISGATGSTYSLVTAMADNGIWFRCVVTNNNGSTASNAAMLTVKQDCDAPGKTAATACARREMNFLYGNVLSICICHRKHE